MTQTGACIFCRIVAGEIPSAPVYQDAEIIAIPDIQPQAPVHVLVMPRAHIVSLGHAEATHEALLGRMLLAAKQIARQAGVAESGYRVITNVGPDSGQVVPHLHWHVLGGRPLGPLVGNSQ